LKGGRGKIRRWFRVWCAVAQIARTFRKEEKMSEGQDEHVRSAEEHVRSEDEEPDVEGHRMDVGRADVGRADAGRADAGRADAGMESETDRNEP
jgi:hypothetical protein